MRPWDNRQRIRPLRTYSGSIVYKRPKHYWTLKDAQRILRYVERDIELAPATKEDGWNLIAQINKFLQAILTFLAWIDPFGFVGPVQYFMLEVVNRIVGINNEPWNADIVLNLIGVIASKTNKFQVMVKWSK